MGDSLRRQVISKVRVWGRARPICSSPELSLLKIKMVRRTRRRLGMKKHRKTFQKVISPLILHAIFTYAMEPERLMNSITDSNEKKLKIAQNQYKAWNFIRNIDPSRISNPVHRAKRQKAKEVSDKWNKELRTVESRLKRSIS